MVVDGADITAVVPRYSNRLVDGEALERLLARKRVAQYALCDLTGMHLKTLWRFKNGHRVLPVTMGWRITSVLKCRIDDFSTQHENAAVKARITSMVWDARHMSGPDLQALIDALIESRAGRA